MFKDRRRPHVLEASIDDTRLWHPASSTRTRAEERERRIDERRHLDRRGQVIVRRAEDAERNQYRRAMLLSFLSTLSRDDLLLWIDRLWLGVASEPQLDALVASVRESPHFADRVASSRMSAGTPEQLRGPHRPNNAWLSAEWRNLSEQLTVLASLRRQHHAAASQTRNGARNSSQYRDAGLASPVGMRVAAAGLFDDFFDRLELTPDEMAARLLQHEVETQLHTLESSTSRTRRGLGSLTAAAAALTAVALFPRWRTFYRGLREKAHTPPADAPRN